MPGRTTKEPCTVPLLTADYFTDPACSWSWCNEPTYRKLRVEFGDQIEWHHRMGGLLEHWDERYYDALYDIRGGDAEAFRDHWREVAAAGQMPIDADLWTEGGIQSTNPTGIAVKAAELQGFEPADRLLRRLREAYMCEKNGLNSAAEILAIAREVEGLDLGRFEHDLRGDRARSAFRADYELTRRPLPEARDTKTVEGRLRYSFPTLVLRNRDTDLRVLDADHSVQDYLDAVFELAPHAMRSGPPGVAELVEMFPTLVTKEVQVIAEVSRDDALRELRALLARGRLRERTIAGESMWLRAVAPNDARSDSTPEAPAADQSNS